MWRNLAISCSPYRRRREAGVQGMRRSPGPGSRFRGNDGLRCGWSSLFRRLLHLCGERLGAGPGVFGNVEQYALGTVEFLLEIPRLRVDLVAVDVMFGAEAFEPLGKFVDVPDQHAEMVNAAVVEALAQLVGLEFEDRHVERAVTQEDAVGEHTVRPSDLLEVECLLVEIGHLLRVLRGNGDVTQLGHRNLLILASHANLSRPAGLTPTPVRGSCRHVTSPPPMGKGQTGRIPATMFHWAVRIARCRSGPADRAVAPVST